MSDDTNENDREFTRVSIRVEAQITAGEETIVSDQTRDVSMSGIFICCYKELAEGSPCDVILLLGDEADPMRIEAKGKVERAVNNGLAIAFTEIGLDSYEHLQNLVLYNSQNAGQVEKEIKSHIGLKRRE